MSALSIIAAAAAVQAATQTGAPTTPPAAAANSSDRVPGESNYVDLEAGVGYSSNPFLTFGSNTGRAFGRLSAHVVHTRVSERSTTLLSVYGQDVTYFGRYGSTQSIAVTAHHDTAINEHVRLFVDASGSYDQGGQLDTRIITTPELPVLPGTPGYLLPVVPPAGDFLSVTGRTFRVAANAGGTFALSARDDLSVSGGAEYVHYRGSSSSSYTSFPLSMSYDRQLSSRSTVGARLSFQSTNYEGPAHYSLITPQFTARTVLSEHLSFDGAIGVSYATINDGIRTTHSTGLAAQANLCWAGQFDHICAYGGTNEQSATVAGPAKSVDAGVTYSRHLGPDSTLSLTAAIDHYSRPVSVITGRTFSDSTYYRLAADYSRQINHRLFGGVTASARKVAQAGPDPKTDLSASAFIRYRFGDIR